MEPLGKFLRRRYGGVFLFVLPVVVGCALLAGFGAFLEGRGVPRETADGVLIISMFVMIGFSGFVLFTRRELPGPLGWWQRCWRGIGSFRARRAERIREVKRDPPLDPPTP